MPGLASAPVGKIEVDLHAHTDSSYDSLTSVEGLIKMALGNGLRAVAITDHESFEGCEKLNKVEKGEGFLVVKGEEVRTEVGDVIGLFLQSGVKSRRIMEVIDEVHSQGGITMLPHPYRGHSWKMIGRHVLDGIDIIEGHNGRTPERFNLEALALAEKMGKPALACSDSHFWPEIGRCRTILGCGLNEEELRREILRGKREFRTSGPLRTMKYLSALLGPSRDTPLLGRARAVAALPFIKAVKVVRGTE